MSLEMTIVMLIAAWLAVACAMLWGVLRIARRHQQSNRQAQQVRPQPARPHAQRPVTAH
ncbi:hypothetical protein RRX38_04740 [Pseudomonas sp. DTU_2021_1001937_2_SI_NGA_ILE_001]|uniref:hypothetical protein n=1 Tax=Pseudomonas sp. DTU_2021_1001937_2_SI_NGA_ILE_001 TaxID=3077589 RepID=UPI0028FC3249|nr:hypothetical protein [Pseudomonas sp. DTU_2021_1001937_2_SI_NGA_ILE_001]WNW10485.1 hypothetical protein RRX38_04740 [Pseudomonas sp. DTU_2021_1001937_2_SI_NGA_ILE_001]